MGFGSVIRELGVRISLAYNKDSAAAVNRSIDTIARNMKQLSIGAGAAIASVLGITDIAAAHSRALQNNSQQLGINVERLQELQYASKIAADMSGEELTGALEGLSNTLFEARYRGGDAAKALSDLQVPLSLLKDKSATADQVLGVLAERFKDLPNGIYKTALANQVFGASGAKILPFLNRGAAGIALLGEEAHRYGLVWTQSVIKSGEQFDQQFSVVLLILKNISYQIGNQLIKHLYPLIVQFEKWYAINKKFVDQGIEKVIKSLGNSLKFVFHFVKLTANKFIEFSDSLGGVGEVANDVALALGFITTLAIVTSIGQMVIAFGSLLTSLILLLPEALLVGGALAGLVYLVKKSEGVGNLQAINDIFKSISEYIDSCVNSLKDLYAIITGSGTVMEKLSKSAGPLGNLALHTPIGMAGTIVAGMAVNSSLDALKTEKNAQAARDTSLMINNLNVSVPNGTSVDDAINIVSGGVTNGFDAQLRSSKLQHTGGNAY